ECTQNLGGSNIFGFEKRDKVGHSHRSIVLGDKGEEVGHLENSRESIVAVILILEVFPHLVRGVEANDLLKQGLRHRCYQEYRCPGGEGLKGTFFVVCSIVGRRYSVDDYFKASSALQDDLHHPGPNLIVVLSFQLVDIRNLDKRGGVLGFQERRSEGAFGIGSDGRGGRHVGSVVVGG